MPLKLFAFYIGGRVKNCLVEVHDVRVCAGESIEACYPQLRAGWWGTKSSLHLDCWGQLSQADGYDIALGDTPDPGAMKLWFVNLGGYDSSQFTELHSNIFVVAPDAAEAKARALKTVAQWQSRHRDGQYDVDALLCVNDLFTKAIHIHLKPAETLRPFRFKCGYRPIGKGD